MSSEKIAEVVADTHLPHTNQTLSIFFFLVSELNSILSVFISWSDKKFSFLSDFKSQKVSLRAAPMILPAMYLYIHDGVKRQVSFRIGAGTGVGYTNRTGSYVY